MAKVERVQAMATMMASSVVDTIPYEYIRTEKEQPAITSFKGSALEVPTIDLGGSSESEAAVVELMRKASSEWGLFQVVNHGIPNDVVSRLQAAGREFFELPAEEKEAYAKPEDSKDVEGYGTKLQKEVEGKKAWVDHLFHRIWPPSAINYRFWPKTPPSYREANEEYCKYLRVVADKLLRYLSVGLGLDGPDLMEAAGGAESLEYMLKINYYPPCPRPDLALGVVAHTDMSTLTILVPNEVPGLQVFRDGLWYDVKYIPNALIIHVGDQLEILSNGVYKAVLHRTTVNKEKVRMSWPVFLEPPSDKVVGPHPKLIDHKNPPKYKTKKYGDYMYCKLNKLPQ
ncbi:hypothetical protein V2J09_000785 [Rumex salicifolius]